MCAILNFLDRIWHFILYIESNKMALLGRSMSRNFFNFAPSDELNLNAAYTRVSLKGGFLVHERGVRLTCIREGGLYVSMCGTSHDKSAIATPKYSGTST